MSPEVKKYVAIGVYTATAGMVLGPGADALGLSEATRYYLTFGATLAPIIWLARDYIDKNNIPTVYDPSSLNERVRNSVQTAVLQATEAVKKSQDIGQGMARPFVSLTRSAIKRMARRSNNSEGLE